MKISTVQPASYLARFTENSSYRKTGLPREVSVQTVSLNKAAFEHAGLGLSAKTTHVLKKAASYLEANPSGMLVIRDYRQDTSKAGLNAYQERTHLVKAYMKTQGVDVSRFVIKGSSATRRLLPRMTLGTELMIEIMGNPRLHR